MSSDAYGIYIHVPFCRRRCPYCNFVYALADPIPDNEYADAVLAEFMQRIGVFQNKRLETLYFGGGTPSLLGGEALRRLIGEIFDQVGCAYECTVECNPEDAEPALAKDLRKAGVSRISLGVQSFDNDVLHLLGRKHNAEQARSAVKIFRDAGIEEISCDIIYAHMLSSPELLRREMAELEALDCKHASLYELTIEQGTAFGYRQNKGERLHVSDDREQDLYAVICEEFSFRRYEISNYSKDGYRSLHNISTWAGIPYLGLGIGAHSYYEEDGGWKRRGNGRNLTQYMQCAYSDGSETEFLSPRQNLAERMFLAMRTLFFFDPEAMATQCRCEVPEALKALLERLVERGFAEKLDNLYRATPKGLRFHDRISLDIVCAID